MPLREDIGKAYSAYYTHASVHKSFAYRLRQRIKRGYAGLAYGYSKQVSVLDRFLALPVSLLPTLRQQVLATGLMYLRGERIGRLLEIGSGGGSFLAGMRDLGWEVEGIDSDPLAVDSARRQYGLEMRHGQFEDEDYPVDHFDAVAMSHVIEHVFDPLALLAKCRRVLRPGGRLVLLTPNVESLGHSRFGSSWVHLDPPRHLHLFSLATLGEMAERSGFDVTTLRSTTRWARGVWILSNYIRNNGTTGMLERGTLNMRLRSVFFQAMEAITLSEHPSKGEEIVLIASKRCRGN
jgi:2-polyprenyl-3-methyl-5-hydroxy-6-metoxy-1,4-benzoquinol methylase